jgi:hypothetical protein
MANVAEKVRWRRTRVYDRADSAILVKADFHPLIEMIKSAKLLSDAGDYKASADVADKIARYFYPTKKAVEVEGTLDADVRIILGGTEAIEINA